MRLLSESRYLLGLRCHKLLWLDEHEHDESPQDAESLFRKNEGTAVRLLACERMGAGVRIAGPVFAPEQKAAATKRAIESGAALIFEATFLAGGAIVSADILRKKPDGWDVIAVKSSTSVKEKQIAEVAMQLWVLRESGLTVPRAYLTHLNGECRFPDLSNLFVTDDITEKAEAFVGDVPRTIASEQAMLRGEVPDIALGAYCKQPKSCVRFDECWGDLPQYHVSTLHGIRWESVEKHLAAGRVTIDNLDEDATTAAPAQRQIRSVHARARVIEDTLAAALDTLQTPVAWLDFETVGLAIPVWPGCAPFTQVPVQFSVHWTGAADNSTRAYLATAGEDPRPGLAAALVKACEGARTIVAHFASFERGCIERLAESVPEHAAALHAINQKIVDLLSIVRDNFYDPEFHGSFSLKRVLPVLVPNLSYKDLAVQDGGRATALLATLLREPEKLGDARAVQNVRTNLLAYCERDTLAMVKLAEALRELA